MGLGHQDEERGLYVAGSGGGTTGRSEQENNVVKTVSHTLWRATWLCF